MASSSEGSDVASRATVVDYLASEETNRLRELVYGMVREPAAPTFHHQLIVGRIHHRLDRHVRRHDAGVVVASPVDVILDRDRALIVQPDLVFVGKERLGICKDRIWGAPDLVVEVLSEGNLRHDRTVKLGWYRTYRVPECWLVDLIGRAVTVVDLVAEASTPRAYEGDETVRSRVLPRLRLKPSTLFDAWAARPRRP